MRCISGILCAAILSAAPVKVVKNGESAEVSINGKPVTALEYGARWDKPFVYPLRTPAGVIVSRGWPVAERPGDSKDHIWQRGLFIGHGDINGVDFWRELGPAKTGRLVPKGAPSWRRNTLSMAMDLITPDKRRLGSITEELRFSQEGAAYLIDARVIFHADAGVALRLGDTEEAAFGVRLREEFREDHGAKLLNASGLTGTKIIWGKRAAWVDYSTAVEGHAAGLAIFDHPANPGAPTYWHARGYGLNSANPFGVRDFTGDKSKDGAMTVPAGGAMTFHYLVVIHDGDAAAAGIPALYERFAAGR